MSHYSAEEPPDPQPARERKFGRYRLAYQIASGGMGTVFLARAKGPGGFEKLVALKRIHPHMADDKRFVSMFLDEARIAARIQHPNVCSVIDFGEVDGNYFLTMPFILGEPMNRVIGTAAKMAVGTLVDALPSMAARMVADACEGLHAAHELRDDAGRYLDVVHRDVSPHNLLVGYDGVVRVLDFGVATAKHRHYQTATGEVKGKFAYLAPEQIEAQPVDRRADVWALGVVLWEAVTARRLFARDSMAATVRAVADMPIPSLRRLRPNAPAGLEDVVAKALARDPAQRYPNARAMGRDLQQILAKQDRFIASAEVAEWMELLLPQARRAQERLVEGTRTGKLEEPPPPSPPPLLNQSSVHRRQDARDPAVLAEGSTPSIAISTQDAVVAHPLPRSTHSIVLAAVGLVAVVAFGAVAGAWWMTREPEAEMRVVQRSEPAGSATPSSTTRTTAEPRPPIRPAPSVAAPSQAASPAAPEAPAVAAAPVEPPGEPVEVEPPPGSAPVEPPAAPVHAAGEPGARVRGSGTLTVATPGGWAFVYLGRRRLGEAPGVFLVPAGTQTITIQPFGRGRRISRRVVVPANGTARLSVPIGS